MRLTDGANRWKGKFLKKGTRIYDTVQVERYNFAEIRRQSVVYPDNPGHNVFHQRLHRKEEINPLIEAGKKVMDEIVSRNMQAPVIYPRDFTKDWVEEKRKARRRNAHRHIDDDEFEMAMEEEEEKERRARAEAIAARSRRGRERGENMQEEADISEKSKEKPESSPPDGNPQTPLQELQSPQFQVPESGDSEPNSESLERTGQELQRFASAISSSVSEDSSFQEGLPGLTTPLKGKTEEEQKESKEEQEGPEEQISPEASGEDADIKEREEVARRAGFESGYEEGRREAERLVKEEMRSEQQKLVDALGSGLSDLKGLRKEILNRAQDNFYEIAGALTESVFEKALKADPGILKNVIDKAVRENLDDENITVRVSPALLERLKTAGISGVDERWLEDPALKDGEFQVNAGDTSLHSSFREMISSLLSEVDISLYEEADKDGKDGKDGKDRKDKP